MKLYYSPNANPRLAVATAKFLKSPVSYIKAEPQNPANKESFKALNPNALVPVLEEDGGTLWEADAIACRLSAIAKSNFWRVGKAQPDMIRWISWATHHLNRAADPLYFFALCGQLSRGKLRHKMRWIMVNVIFAAMRLCSTHICKIEGG